MIMTKLILELNKMMIMMTRIISRMINNKKLKTIQKKKLNKMINYNEKSINLFYIE